MRFNGFRLMPDALSELYAKCLIDVFKQIDRMRELGGDGSGRSQDVPEEGRRAADLTQDRGGSAPS